MGIDVEKARDFVLANGRLLDKRRFGFLWEGGTASEVLVALRPYQNADGGFGQALEPDMRCSASQPVATEQALHVLDEIGLFDPGIVDACCDWPAGVGSA